MIYWTRTKDVILVLERKSNMISKIATKVGSFALRKISNTAIDKSVQKLNKPYGEFKREIMQIKPLNIGEDKSMHCYRTMPNDTSGFCKKVFEYEIDKYHKTKKYK